MFPIIFQIGPIRVYSYGLMLAIAVVVCSIFLSRDAKKYDIKTDVISDLIFWVVVAGIVGARIFFICLNLPFFLENPSEIVMIQHGGLAWQGGVILGALAGAFYVKLKKLSFILLFDLCAPYVALGQAIGRLGCFLNGCCFGKKASWGIFFPVHNAHLQPTQLYDAAGLFIVFLILKSLQKKHMKTGKVFVMYLMLAAPLRFIVEFWRDDHSTLALGLSVFQWMCVGLVTVGIVLWKRTNVGGVRERPDIDSPEGK